MTEEDLIELGFEKVEYEHYYNYVKGDMISCDSDLNNGKWYVMFDFPNSKGVVANKSILKQLVFKLDEKDN